MVLAAYERSTGDVNAWVDEQTHALTVASISVIECTDLVQGNTSVILLPCETFLPFLQATHQPVAFLYRGACDVPALIQAAIEDVCETDEEPTLLVRAFEQRHEAPVTLAKAACPTHFYAELTVLHQGGFVTAGVVAQPYDDLLEALRSFCEDAEAQRERAVHAQELEDSETLELLADELMKDPAFAAIRGKRKRCVYVAEMYGTRVPTHAHRAIKRPDQTCDPMDTNLVDLVERVSDRLDVMR